MTATLSCVTFWTGRPRPRPCAAAASGARHDRSGLLLPGSGRAAGCTRVRPGRRVVQRSPGRVRPGLPPARGRPAEFHGGDDRARHRVPPACRGAQPVQGLLVLRGPTCRGGLPAPVTCGRSLPDDRHRTPHGAVSYTHLTLPTIYSV